jgi:hypothetical protein
MVWVDVYLVPSDTRVPEIIFKKYKIFHDELLYDKGQIPT